jgi:glycosyltransferase involved in cell wall biosynthesis
MRLAFDFTSAVKSEPTGIARYVVEILRAMLPKLAPEDRVVLGYRLSRWKRRASAPRFDDPRVLVRPLQSPLAFLTYGRPDVFHGLGVNVPLGLPASTRRFVTIHGFIREDEVDPNKRAAYRARLRKIQTMLGRADRGFVVSAYERDRTAELCGCSPAKLKPVYHGVDHAKYRPAGDPERDRRVVADRWPREAAKGVRPFFLCLGAVTARKNVPLLLEAFAKSRARRDFDLVLAGQMRGESPQILQAVPRLGLGASVHAIGHVPPDDVPSWLRSARALVHPSRYESFGLPLIEAMACGAPVASTDASAIPEICGGAAQLFQPTVDAVAHTLDRLASEDSLCADLRARGLARAREFTWERAADETLATYREVLGAAARQGAAAR